MGIIYDIISELQRKKYIPEKKFLLIKPAIDYINNNFTNSNLSYPYLAELCNISYSYLSRIFIEKFGISPQKYITQLRINYACDLLKSGIYNVTQTAELVGITDVYFFNKVFKEQMGMPPGKYRNSV
ncbi:MAG: helix-turn-helix transcriptional regulator [Ruminococcaceae bacterium]|nr:helix-turn-helix transcriptional regulator [Oscillospiraceae bacterium]